LWRRVKDHYNQVANITTLLQTEIEQVSTAHVQITIVERGIIERWHGFEVLIDALVHAE
jgi:hypothetical protein